MASEKKRKTKMYRPIIKNVAFFGDANIEKEDEVYKEAYETAKILAGEGYVVVNGGGPGVMAAATAGAEAVGGETLAITFNPQNAPGFEGRYLGNVTDKEIVTANYVERMFKLMEHADVYLMFKGGTGTISEFGTAWVLGKLYYGHHKPFVLVGSFWRPIVKVIQENLNIDETEMDVFRMVDHGREVLEVIRRMEEKLQSVDHEHCRVCEEGAYMT